MEEERKEERATKAHTANVMRPGARDSPWAHTPNDDAKHDKMRTKEITIGL